MSRWNNLLRSPPETTRYDKHARREIHSLHYRGFCHPSPFNPPIVVGVHGLACLGHSYVLCFCTWARSALDPHCKHALESARHFPRVSLGYHDHIFRKSSRTKMRIAPTRIKKNTESYTLHPSEITRDDNSTSWLADRGRT